MPKTYFKNKSKHPLPLTALSTGHGQMAPAVQLQHTMPNGSWHIDLLIAPPAILQQPSDDARCLLTFRLPLPLYEIDGSSPSEITRLRDHRFFYFMHEGKVSGNRGHVERLALGAIDPIASHCWNNDLTADSIWMIHTPSGIKRKTVRFRLEWLRDSQWLLWTGF